MRDALFFLATCLLGTLGFALLAFSQRQHWPLLRRARQNPPTLPLRLMGAALLALALLPAICRDGVAFGLLLWSVTMTLAAAVVVVILLRLSPTNDPR